MPPPALTPDDPRHPSHDPRYAALAPADLPLTECLKDTVARFLPLLARDHRARRSRSGQRVLIAAHGNSLRALVKYLDNIPDADIVGLNIPTGIPLVYELTDDLKPIKQLLPGRSRGGEEGRRGRRRAAQAVDVTQGVIRWARRLLALAACAVLLAVLAHTPPVRTFVLSQVMSRLSAATGLAFDRLPAGVRRAPADGGGRGPPDHPAGPGWGAQSSTRATCGWD